MTTTKTSNAVMYGLMMAIISILFTMILYFVNIKLMYNMFLALFVGLILWITFIISAVNFRKKAQGGYIKFAEGLREGLIVITVAYFISVIFNFILYKLIDPDLANRATDIIRDNTVSIMERFNAPEESIEKSIEGITPETLQPSIKNSLLGFINVAIIGGIISLIVAAVKRKDKPEFIEEV